MTETYTRLEKIKMRLEAHKRMLLDCDSMRERDRVRALNDLERTEDIQFLLDEVERLRSQVDV